MKWFGATLVFFAEIGMLVGFAWWGFQAADGLAGWALAVAVPAVAITLWGLFLAPKAPRRLKGFMLALVRFDALLLGAIAAWFGGAHALGMATLVCTVIGTAAARGFERDDHVVSGAGSNGAGTSDAGAGAE